MTMTTRIPTTTAECGCPYDPEYDEGSLGWHLSENHSAIFPLVRRRTPPHGDTWVECVGGPVGVHRFRVKQYFVPHLTEPTHMLVCDVCGMHLHADFEISA
jgi:hypothetical protein